MSLMPIPQNQFGGLTIIGRLDCRILCSSCSRSSGNTKVRGRKPNLFSPHRSVISWNPRHRLSFRPIVNSPGNWLIRT